jgi:hypothetical protein
VSPDATVFDAVRAPHHFRTGLPAESHNSTPTIVAAGMFVTVTAPELAADPAEAAPNATVGAPAPDVYPPEVASSVPLLETVPFAVINRHRIGAVDAVNAAVATLASTTLFACA